MISMHMRIWSRLKSLHGLQVPTTAILTNSMRYMLYRCYPTQYMLYCCLPVRVEDKERVIRGRALPLHRADITLSFSHQAFGIPPPHAGLADIKLLILRVTSHEVAPRASLGRARTTTWHLPQVSSSSSSFRCLLAQLAHCCAHLQTWLSILRSSSQRAAESVSDRATSCTPECILKQPCAVQGIKRFRVRCSASAVLAGAGGTGACRCLNALSCSLPLDA